MSYWKSIEEVFLYDGTFDGLLTILFNCYVNQTIPSSIIPQASYTFNFLDTTLTIPTDVKKAERVFHGIAKNISRQALYHAYYAFSCEVPQKELAIVKYLYHGFKVGPQIDTMLSIDYVFSVHAMRKRALSECHRLKGLLRFMELDNHIFYASIHPEHAILEPLGHHFIRRFPNQAFIIHDKIRSLAFLYNGTNYQIEENVSIEALKLSHEEKTYQELWKTFFETISIKGRSNLRLQMQYMPKKYWQDLIEIP